MIRPPRSARFVCVAALMLIVCGPLPQASAQRVGFDPTGVYIDPKGVLHARRIEDGKKLADLITAGMEAKGDGSLRFISLPRLLAQVRAKLDAGQPVPDEMKYLGGIVKLRYIAVFPQEKDLVIGGVAEPIDTTTTDRPIGGRTGRPVLQLDDLVTLLRTCGPGRTNNAFGCKIEATVEGSKRMVQTLDQLASVVRSTPEARGAVAGNMAKAAGPQEVKWLSLDANTRVAYVAVEADYLLKRMVVGLDRPPVSGVMTYLDMQSKPDVISNRFWFEAAYDPLLASADGNAFEIRGQALRILTERQFTKVQEPSKEAGQYATHITKHLERLSRAVIAFADLTNISDLALLAALIGTDKLHEKAGWDVAWLLDPKGYPVPAVKTPQSAATVVNYKATPSVVIYVGGGVQLGYEKIVSQREADEKGVLQAARRQLPGPEAGQWRVDVKP